jgi:hypothetical protein
MLREDDDSGARMALADGVGCLDSLQMVPGRHSYVGEHNIRAQAVNNFEQLFGSAH